MQTKDEAEKIARLSALILNMDSDGQERAIILLNTLKFAQENRSEIKSEEIEKQGA